ncbi:unnamed protein product [Lepidochelys kempii]
MHQPWLPSLQPSRCGDHPACAGEASLAAHAPSPAAFDVPSGGWPPPPAALAAGKRPRQQAPPGGPPRPAPPLSRARGRRKNPATGPAPSTANQPPLASCCPSSPGSWPQTVGEM